ncbi:MAG: glycosyltransferase family 39 protein [Wenzhouxiangellaceae bacterium]
MNLQVAASLADGHGYARFYDEWILFPEEVQTNAPFILPASLVFALFGVSLVSAQLVSIAYAVALILVVFWLVRPAAGRTAALAATSLVLLSPEFSRFGANGYGEAPGLVWFLLGLGFFCRAFGNEQIRYYLIAGMCLGLAVLTKTVMLMPVGILLALAGMNLIVRRRWQALAATALAFAMPIAAFEAWRAASLGGATAWSNWWGEQYSSILSQAGVQEGFENIPVWTDKLIAHATILADNLSLPVWLLPVLALIPVGLALIAVGELRKPEPSRERVLLVGTLAVSITAYFVWWLLVTPTQKAWHRRIFNGLLLLAIAAPIVIEEARQRLRSRPVLTLIAALPVLALIYSGLVNFKFAASEKSRLRAIREVVEFMREAPPNARFYGYNWYSAPIVSLYSGRRVHDLGAWKYFIKPGTRPHYLLVDAQMVRTGVRERALRNFDYRTVVDNPSWAWVAEITSEFRFHEIPTFEAGQMVGQVNFLESEYDLLQGFHRPESRGRRWVEASARIVLERAAAERLVVSGYLASLDRYRIMGQNDGISLEAVVGDCSLGARQIERSGKFELAWSLDSCPNPPHGIVFVELHANAVIRRIDRELSWIVHSIGFSE